MVLSWFSAWRGEVSSVELAWGNADWTAQKFGGMVVERRQMSVMDDGCSEFCRSMMDLGKLRKGISSETRKQSKTSLV
jgi:hypothetical protein